MHSQQIQDAVNPNRSFKHIVILHRSQVLKCQNTVWLHDRTMANERLG
jgi:hypothetical protein